MSTAKKTKKVKPEEIPALMGRPTKFDRAFIQAAYDYIASCQDEVDEFWKTRGEKSDSYDRIIKVKLPTIEGFATHLRVAVKTLYNWAETDNDFLQALEDIKTAQRERLLEKGLSGDYNPTIAKLILSSNHGMKERVDQTTDDQPLPTPVTVNNFKHLSDDELIKLAGGSKEGAGA